MMARMSSAPASTSARSRSDPRGRPIGVFDSGVGGLTVLHELLVRLPRADFLYLGDTARFPYGERTPEELTRFAAQTGTRFLQMPLGPIEHVELAPVEVTA